MRYGKQGNGRCRISNLVPRSLQSESLVGWSMVRFQRVGLELDLHLWVLGRWARNPFHHLHFPSVAMEPERAKTGPQHVVCCCSECQDICFMERKKNASHLRRNITTSAPVGRWAGFWCQQLSVMSHTESTRPRLCASNGRTGRSPSAILNIAVK